MIFLEKGQLIKKYKKVMVWENLAVSPSTSVF